MRLVLTGGGTGGHIYPGLALAEAFGRQNDFAPLDVLFIGTRDRLEARLVPQAGLPIAFVRAAPLERRLSLSFAVTAAANAAGFLQALAVLHRARPDILIATGGYVALPVVVALRVVRFLGRSRARIALLEPNARSGLTNRLLAPLADEIWYGASPGRALGPREHVTGTPVRAAMRERLDPSAARTRFGLRPDRTTVAVFGGSQGARSLNEAVAELALAGLPAQLQILLVTGTRDYASVEGRLRGSPDVCVRAYLDEPSWAYAAADFVIARAGASTLAELAATGTPAILVPYPHATDDHQTYNALAFAASGAARVVPDASIDGTYLRTILLEVLAPDASARMTAAAHALAAADPCAAIVARVKTWSFANSVEP